MPVSGIEIVGQSADTLVMKVCYANVVFPADQVRTCGVCQVLCVRCSKFTVETFQQMRWRNNLKRLSSQKEAWTISS